MTEYLSYQFIDSEAFIDTFDELPLWSAPFGMLLLKHLEMKPGLKVIDLGSGAGFPLMELAGRLGKSCTLYGIDPWSNAINRARKKIINYGLTNVELIETSAEEIPFENNSIDLIVSNLGINNFENPGKVFIECNRVLKSGGKLALTTNLNGHWKEFYTVFEKTLTQLGQDDVLTKLMAHQEHRGTVASISTLFSNNGFKVSRFYEDSFDMRFLDGSAFLNHYFVKLGWLSSWRELIPADIEVSVFEQLEQHLNNVAKEKGGLCLNVPMAFIEGENLSDICCRDDKNK